MVVALDNSDRERRLDVVLILAHVGPPASAAAPRLLRLFDECQGLDRLLVAHALARIDPTVRETFAGQAVPLFVEHLRRWKNETAPPDVFRLRSLDPVVSLAALGSGANSALPVLREELSRAARETGDAPYAVELARAMLKIDPATRAEVVRELLLLAKLTGNSAAPALFVADIAPETPEIVPALAAPLDRLADSEETARQSKLARAALLRIAPKNPAVAPVLLSRIDVCVGRGQSPQTYLTLLRDLGAEAAPALLKRLDGLDRPNGGEPDRLRVLNDDLIQQLGEWGDPAKNAVPLLLTHVQDERPERRRAVLAALRKLAPEVAAEVAD